MRQTDDRDSEPDYLLRLTRHGLGGTLLDYSAFLFSAQVTGQRLGFEAGQEGAAMTSSQQSYVILNQQ